MKKDEPKVLYLIIKQKYFDMIMAGTKKQEFREVRPTNISKLLELEPDPENPGQMVEIEDENGNAIPIKYDAIRFAVGYNKDRDTALVEVKDAYAEIFVDEDGKIIEYEYKGQLWYAEQVVYELGRIIESDIHHKHKK